MSQYQTSQRLPVLFVSHGAPTYALEPGLAGAQLRALGQRLPPVKAVLMVSAHWNTVDGVQVTSSAQPPTIHDFGGFPDALYAVTYPAPGDPALAARTVALLKEAGIKAGLDARRGLDHGAWVPLVHMLPDATIPVLQVSLPFRASPQDAAALGHALAPLRDEGVLIIASGSLTHNLYEYRQRHDFAEDYVKSFTHWTRSAVTSGNLAELLGYRDNAPHAARAHPSEEHFTPLFVTMGATAPGEAVTVLDGGIMHGVLSMESYVIGELPVSRVQAEEATA